MPVWQMMPILLLARGNDELDLEVDDERLDELFAEAPEIIAPCVVAIDRYWKMKAQPRTRAEDRPQRTLPLRVRAEVQAVLRQELRSTTPAAALRLRSSQARGHLRVVRERHDMTDTPVRWRPPPRV